MKTTIDAMKQALEALSDIPLTALHAHKINAHMNACFLLKEAVAREEAQTLEQVNPCPNYANCQGMCFQCECFDVESGEMKYPEPANVTCQIYGHVVGACAECNTHDETQQVPMTDDQISKAFDEFANQFDLHNSPWLDMGADEYFKAGFLAAQKGKQ